MRQRYSDDLPYGPGNPDYENDGRVQRVLDAELEGEKAASHGFSCESSPFSPGEPEHNAWCRGWLREQLSTYGGRPMEKITETPITNGAYNEALNDAIAECQKLIGEFTINRVIEESGVRFARALLQRIEALRLG